jgi:hypothetical protein
LLTDDGSNSVYVGKSTDLRSRVMQHKQANAHVPGWSRAVLVKRDTSNGFTSADVGYLEGRLSAELDAISGITVVKGKTDGDATLPAHMQMSLDSLLSSILASVRLAGIDTHREDEDEQPPLRSAGHRSLEPLRTSSPRGYSMQAQNCTALELASTALARSPQMDKSSCTASDTPLRL